ncbi:probable 2-oxoglutarate-dependent dioxygenase AOP1.2 isoform X2 [Cajanus cajan]|uniref:probable 2-oxoglutarate-dependent dioxygenase AOP1.2 isoform X2 n=1 Tax=Cajanus cajan TaxID=3821 RepID=UPI0010FB8A3E|nr:probable 2-oxoglutarate-dependent dioxygenase AOP1.2 isoform X2 [Cajanus cajan]
MGSETEASLPVIDFSIEDLESNVAEWELVKSQVHKALVEYGCFEAVFDKVPLDLRKAIFLEVEEMFDLPLQTKQRVVSSRPYHGYVGPVQIYESMGIEDADVHDKVESLIKILWPQGKPSFSKNLQFFIEQVSRLDQIIRKMILESLGVEKYLEEHMNSTNYLARLIKYEGPQTNEAKFGLVEHTDKNIFTTLCQNQIDGLEAWTNGRVHTPVHRVMMSGNETRFSIGLFTVPKPGLIIKAPDELVTEEHPLLFKPFVQSEFMKFLRSSEGIKNALKVYCGV